ncbi:hypothetical protein [Actinoplanes sp. RD1]|uniref:hypothetical protein n=1 Tax=Actinoplanes sp. RD1 TaxID=3064538 RepID=UPI0027405897|nr:hypothetical protein [Actinoplanes sp. RD1]
MTTTESRPPRFRGRRRRSVPRLPRIVLAAVAAILVVVAAVALLGRGHTSPSPAAAPSATASVAPPAAGDNVINADGEVVTDSPVKAGTTSKGTTTTKTGTTVALPAELGDRPLLTDPDYVGIGAGLDIKLDGVPAGAATVGGVYGNPTEGDVVLVAAAATDLATPAATLTTAFINAAVGGLPLTGVADVAPGSLGGAAKCGKAEAGGANLVMCGWADASSTGRIIWYFTSLKTAQAEFTKLRAQIEKPSN